MPWGERAEILYNYYKLDVCERTLRNWTEKLFRNQTFVKDELRTYWKSMKIDENHTERVQVPQKEFNDFYKFRREQQAQKIAEKIADGRTDYDEIKKESWSEAHFAAMSKFKGWCYFSCKTIIVPAFDDKHWVELLELCDNIAISQMEYANEEFAKMREERLAAIKAEIARTTQKNDEFIF